MDQPDWFGSDIIDWLRNIWNELTSLPAKAANLVKDKVDALLDDAVDLINSYIRWLLDQLTSKLEEVRGFFETLLSDLQGQVTERFDSIRSYLAEAIESPIQFIKEHPLLVLGPAGLIAELMGAISPAFNQMLTHFFDSATQTISGWFDNLKDWVTREIADPITDWFSGLTDRLIQYFEGLKEALRKAVTTLGEILAEYFTEDVLPAFLNAFEWIRRWADQLWDSAISTLHGFIERIGRVRPEQGPSVATNLLILAGTTAVGLGIFTVAGRAMTHLAGMGLGNLAAIIGDLVNYRTLTAAWVGVLAGALITTPLRYYYNLIIRPWLPDRGTIAEAMSRNMFGSPETLMPPDLAAQIRGLVGGSAEEFEKRMLGYHGFGDEWYPIYKELANTPARYFPLRMVADIGVYDERWFIEELQRAGYSSTTIEQLLDVFRRQAMGEVRALYATKALTLYKEGLIDDELLKQHLRALGVPEGRLEQFCYAAHLDYQYDYAADLINSYREAYRKGLIDESEYLSRLQQVGLRPERAQGLLARDRLRRKIEEKEEPEKESRGMYASRAMALFRAGFITEQKLREHLRVLGVSDGLHDLYIYAAMLDYKLDYARDFMRLIRESYRNRALTAEEYRENMRWLGLREDRIDILLELDTLRMKEEEAGESAAEHHREKIRSLMRMFRDGFLTEDQFRANLRWMGLTEEEINDIVVTATLQWQHEHMRERVDALKAAYRAGLIDEEALRTELANMGLAPPNIDTILMEETARKYGKSRKGR